MISEELARRIRVVILDADGVLTDGGIYLIDGDGPPRGGRRFHVHDGVGIFMLRRAGVEVAIVSGKLSPAVRARAAELGIEEVHQVNPLDKLPAVEALLSRLEADWSEAAFMGDDIADIPVLRHVGLPCAVDGAAPEVRSEAAWCSARPGGAGAVREFAEDLLRTRGEWTALVESYISECEIRWKGEAVDGTTGRG